MSTNTLTNTALTPTLTSTPAEEDTALETLYGNVPASNIPILQAGLACQVKGNNYQYDPINGCILILSTPQQLITAQSCPAGKWSPILGCVTSSTLIQACLQAGLYWINGTCNHASELSLDNCHPTTDTDTNVIESNGNDSLLKWYQGQCFNNPKQVACLQQGNYWFTNATSNEGTCNTLSDFSTNSTICAYAAQYYTVSWVNNACVATNPTGPILATRPPPPVTIPPLSLGTSYTDIGCLANEINYPEYNFDISFYGGSAGCYPKTAITRMEYIWPTVGPTGKLNSDGFTSKIIKWLTTKDALCTPPYERKMIFTGEFVSNSMLWNLSLTCFDETKASTGLIDSAEKINNNRGVSIPDYLITKGSATRFFRLEQNSLLTKTQTYTTTAVLNYYNTLYGEKSTLIAHDNPFSFSTDIYPKCQNKPCYGSNITTDISLTSIENAQDHGFYSSSQFSFNFEHWQCPTSHPYYVAMKKTDASGNPGGIICGKDSTYTPIRNDMRSPKCNQLPNASRNPDYTCNYETGLEAAFQANQQLPSTPALAGVPDSTSASKTLCPQGLLTSFVPVSSSSSMALAIGSCGTTPPPADALTCGTDLFSSLTVYSNTTQIVGYLLTCQNNSSHTLGVTSDTSPTPLSANTLTCPQVPSLTPSPFYQSTIMAPIGLVIKGEAFPTQIGLICGAWVVF